MVEGAVVPLDALPVPVESGVELVVVELGVVEPSAVVVELGVVEGSLVLDVVPEAPVPEPEGAGSVLLVLGGEGEGKTVGSVSVCVRPAGVLVAGGVDDGVVVVGAATAGLAAGFTAGFAGAVVRSGGLLMG